MSAATAASKADDTGLKREVALLECHSHGNDDPLGTHSLLT